MSRIVVLFGGESSEHEVSLASGREVVASLEAAGRTVLPVVIDRSGRWHPGVTAVADGSAGSSAESVLDGVPAEAIVFPVLHGGWGEGGGLQRELEDRRLAFVGCDAASSALGMAKSAMGRACAAAGVARVPSLEVSRAAFLADPGLLVAALARALPFPLVVKPEAGGSSIGVSIVTAPSGLRAALERALAGDTVALIQAFIEGAEVSVGVWTDRDGRTRVSGASLLHLPQGHELDGFSYEHKYSGAGGRLEIPASFPSATLTALQSAALTVFAALGGFGLARVDFFVPANGVPVFNEINTMPGLRRESHFPRLVAAAGTDYDELLELLIAGATSRFAARRSRNRPTAMTPAPSARSVAESTMM